MTRTRARAGAAAPVVPAAVVPVPPAAVVPVVRAAVVPVAAILVTVLLAATGCGSVGDAAGSAGDGDGPGEQTLTVLAAASLTDVLDEIVADFEADHPGVTVEQSFAASSTIVQQVNEGAPADVIALAGAATLDPLEDERRVGEPVVLATNTLELVVPADNPAGITGVEDLARDGIRLVVCAVEVPCGRATATIFDQLGLDPAVASYEHDVRATLTKVTLGEADAGIVYRTDVLAAGDAVSGIEIPPADNVTTAYPVLAVSDAPLAGPLVDELSSARAREHLAAAGFGAP
jgi:molybdate transport system substrate-binding protein